MRLRQQTSIVHIIWQDLGSVHGSVRNNGHTYLLRLAYSWSMGLGRPWPHATLWRELLVEDGDHGQNSQAYQGCYDLECQHAAQAERFPRIKDTSQASTDRDKDK